MRNIGRGQIFIGLILACICLFILTCAAADTGLDVPKRTESEIADFIAGHPSAMPDQVFDEQPDLEAPFNPGRLSDAALQAALNALNQVRFVAGVSANITLNASYSEKCQAGALINAVNNALSHTPARPEGMSDELFDLGYSGTSSSNIAMGYNTLSAAVFNGWMNDGDSSNISRIGHRRWVLNPKMTSTGFGQVGRYMAMYAFSTDSSAAVPETVAWPAQLMPVRWMSASLPWHVSFRSGVSGTDQVSVTLTRRSDNRTWTFSEAAADGYFNISSGGYGTGTAVIFRPSDIEYFAGDVFDVMITGAGNDTLRYTVELYSYDIQYMKIGEIEPRTFTGSEIRPEVTVSAGGTVLREGTDYSVSYSGNINESDYAAVTITGTGKYSGTRTVYFSIQPADISEVQFDVSDLYYTGSASSCPKVTGTLGNFELQQGTHFSVSDYSRLTDAGEGTVTIKGIRNISGERILTYRVLPRPMSDVNCYLKQTEVLYSGEACTPELWYIYYGSYDLQQDTDYLISYDENLNTGTAAVIVTGTGNFTGERRLEFTISPRSVFDVEMTLEYSECVYSGLPCMPELSEACYGSYHLEKGTDYLIAYENNTEAGLATVTVTGQGNFTGTRNLYFYIKEPLDISWADVILEYEEHVFSGEALTPAVTVYYGEIQLTEGTDYTVTYRNNTEPGLAEVIVEGTGNYTGSRELYFMILNPADDPNTPVSPDTPDNPDNPSAGRIYTVTVRTDGNGTASADRSGGEEGETVTLTAVPNEGFLLKKWKVISGGITIRDNQFTIGTANVEIQAVFTKMKGTVTSGGLKYKLEHETKTASVTGVKTKTVTEVKIPATVKANGLTYKVTAINENAFRGLKKLAKVTIGSKVAAIGKNAFHGCTGLKTVSGMSGVTTIGEGAFRKCTSLSKITLPAKVKKIGKDAFSGDKKLKTITIKTTKLTSGSIGANAFKGIHSGATVRCPKSKLKAYKKILVKRGIPKTAKITK